MSHYQLLHAWWIFLSTYCLLNFKTLFILPRTSQMRYSFTTNLIGNSLPTSIQEGFERSISRYCNGLSKQSQRCNGDWKNAHTVWKYKQKSSNSSIYSLWKSISTCHALQALIEPVGHKLYLSWESDDCRKSDCQLFAIYAKIAKHWNRGRRSNLWRNVLNHSVLDSKFDKYSCSFSELQTHKSLDF